MTDVEIRSEKQDYASSSSESAADIAAHVQNTNATDKTASAAAAGALASPESKLAEGSKSTQGPKVAMPSSKPKRQTATTPEVFSRREWGPLKGPAKKPTGVTVSIQGPTADTAAAVAEAEKPQNPKVVFNKGSGEPAPEQRKPSVRGTEGGSTTKKTSSTVAKATVPTTPKVDEKSGTTAEQKEIEVQKKPEKAVPKTNNKPKVRHSIRKSASPSQRATATVYSRVLQPNDPVLREMRSQKRRAASMADFESAAILLDTHDPVPRLPPVVEKALVDYYKMGLLRQPVTEIERIVGTVCPVGDRKVVMTYLKSEQQHMQTAAANTTPAAAGGGNATDKRGEQRPQWCRSPKLKDHSVSFSGPERPRNSPTVAAGRRRTDQLGEQAASVARFHEIFSNEVRAAFLEECFAACQGRRSRFYREQPRMAQEKGVVIPEELLQPHYERAVGKVLFRMFGWPEEEAAAHSTAIVRVFARKMPPMAGVGGASVVQMNHVYEVHADPTAESASPTEQSGEELSESAEPAVERE